jgi:hypothetical protein
MLVSAKLVGVPTVDRLVKIWSDRYLPDLSALSIGSNPSILGELRQASSSAGRVQTANKLYAHLVDKNCKLAAIRVKDLYAYLSGVVDFGEVKRLADSSTDIYLKLLELYQESPSITVLSVEELWSTYGDSPLAAWGIPRIEKLADTLEPLLLQFQEQHLISKDWKMLGFITTQINFSNALLLEQLTPVEQVLINPYLKFLEEQVALPWQRLCAAAAKHNLNSPAFVLVEQLTPIASDIAATTYARLLRFFPNYYSRRGKLSNLAVKHSCLRDLTMFQVYLWLCVLQGDLNVVEQELVALCIMVMESVGVEWRVIAKWNKTLMDEVLNRLDSPQRMLVTSYAEGMIAAFQDSQDRFKATS